MSINIEALELAMALFRSNIQDEIEPNFSACLRSALELQCEENTLEGRPPALSKKKCPFCGYAGNRIESWEAGDHTEYAILCLNCGALGPNDLGRSGAVEGWNMRRRERPADRAG